MSVDRYDLVVMAVLVAMCALTGLLGRWIARDHGRVVAFSRLYGLYSIMTGATGCVLVWQAWSLYFTFFGSTPLDLFTDLSVRSALMVVSGIAAVSMRSWVFYPIAALSACTAARLAVQLFGPLPLRACFNFRLMMTLNLFDAYAVLVMQWLAAVVYWRYRRTERLLPVEGRYTFSAKRGC